MKIVCYIFAILALVSGPVAFVFWNKSWGKYMPSEDSLLLKIVTCIVYCIAGGILCGTFASTNKYAIYVGMFLFLIVIVASCILGFYYKTVNSHRHINEF